jgi:hypothetical protein
MVASRLSPRRRSLPGPATPIQIYGAPALRQPLLGCWRVRVEFDVANHWLIDRGDGRPSVNLVVLRLVNPLKLLSRAIRACLNMIPAGMTQDVVNH